jgi:D-mannonate dehydratase
MQVIRDLRECRGLMVQHVTQAEFAHKALVAYVKAHAGSDPRRPLPATAGAAVEALPPREGAAAAKAAADDNAATDTGALWSPKFENVIAMTRKAHDRVDEAEAALKEHDAHPPPGEADDVANLRDELAQTASIARKKFNKQLKHYQEAAEAAGLPTDWPPAEPLSGRVRSVSRSMFVLPDPDVEGVALAATSSPYSAAFEQAVAQTRAAEERVQESQRAMMEFDTNPPPGNPEDIDNMRVELATAASIARKKLNKQLKLFQASAEAAGLPTEWPQLPPPPAAAESSPAPATTTDDVSTPTAAAVPSAYSAAFQLVVAETHAAEASVQESQAAVEKFDAHRPPGDPEDIDNMREELATTASIARKKFNKQLKKFVVHILLLNSVHRRRVCVGVGGGGGGGCLSSVELFCCSSCLTDARSPLKLLLFPTMATRTRAALHSHATHKR